MTMGVLNLPLVEAQAAATTKVGKRDTYGGRKDYYIYDDAISGTGFTTEPMFRKKNQTEGPYLPTIIVGTNKFDDYSTNKNGYNLGDLVRDVYHESVHIRLQKGTLPGFKDIYPTRGDGKNMHEAVASYFQLTNTTLPDNSDYGIKNIASYGSSSYNLMSESPAKKSISHMNDFFEKLNLNYKKAK